MVAQNSGVLNIQRDAAAAVIDSDANAQVTQVQGMTNMSSDDQTAFLKQIETHRNNVKTDLSNATSAADLQTKINAANVTMTQDGSQAELDDYGQSALKQVNQMPDCQRISWPKRLKILTVPLPMVKTTLGLRA
ncbi:unnamed protein product [Fructobacillus tropaeoli]|uniref:hypothetical protein n=1 Tax=Fructobacillus TaxID=559173 RepID=UPI00064D9675|nr:hypothetical protein [Fructobacillus sp. EFB-N1]KMK53916.1 hypothetical protein FEFB_03600 [Fructobacillus sp. EFB-N1]CAK1234959.1 unnamed protein product [Fructobacillus tropaeoli]